MHPIIKPKAAGTAPDFAPSSFSAITHLGHDNCDPELEQLYTAMPSLRIDSTDASSSEALLNAERDSARPEHSGLGSHLANIRSFKIVPKRPLKSTISPAGIADIGFRPCDKPADFLSAIQDGRTENLKRKPLDQTEPHDKCRRLDNG
jgi:hypothetical protein